MGEERAKQIICNLLYQICNYTDIAEGGVVNYFNWLRTEIGLSIDEIHELQSMENFCFPAILDNEKDIIDNEDWSTEIL